MGGFLIVASHLASQFFDVILLNQFLYELSH